MHAVKILQPMTGPGVLISAGQFLVVGDGCDADTASRLVESGLAVEAKKADVVAAECGSLIPVEEPEAVAPTPRQRADRSGEEEDDEEEDAETAEEPADPAVEHAALRTKKPAPRTRRGK